MKPIHAQTAKRLLSLALPFVFFHTSAATAQGGDPMTLGDFEARGYVMMDDINTPLLHHVHTGEPYDLRVLARGDGMSSVPHPHGALRGKANRPDDEFVRRDANIEWSPIVHKNLEKLRNARGYLIPLRSQLGEYDFANQRFPVELRMVKKPGLQSITSYHCAGAYAQRAKGEYWTACLTASNLNENEPFLRYFPLSDLGLARQIRQGNLSYRFFALAEPAGKYRRLQGNEIRYQPSDIYAAAGLLPVKIIGLLLTDVPGTRIYASTIKQGDPAPATSAADTAAPIGKAQANPGRPPTSGDGKSNWKLIAQANDARFYSDAASLRREGPTVVVRQMTDFREGVTSGFRSTETLIAHNCNRRTIKQLSVKFYEGSMGEGALYEESAALIDQGSPTAGSSAEAMFNFACNANPVNP